MQIFSFAFFAVLFFSSQAFAGLSCSLSKPAGSSNTYIYFTWQSPSSILLSTAGGSCVISTSSPSVHIRGCSLSMSGMIVGWNSGSGGYLSPLPGGNFSAYCADCLYAGGASYEVSCDTKFSESDTDPHSKYCSLSQAGAEEKLQAVKAECENGEWGSGAVFAGTVSQNLGSNEYCVKGTCEICNSSGFLEDKLAGMNNCCSSGNEPVSSYAQCAAQLPPSGYGVSISYINPNTVKCSSSPAGSGDNKCNVERPSSGSGGNSSSSGGNEFDMEECKVDPGSSSDCYEFCRDNPDCAAGPSSGSSEESSSAGGGSSGSAGSSDSNPGNSSNSSGNGGSSDSSGDSSNSNGSSEESSSASGGSSGSGGSSDSNPGNSSNSSGNGNSSNSNSPSSNSSGNGNGGTGGGTGEPPPPDISSSSGSDSANAVTCENLNECDWAKFGKQIEGLKLDSGAHDTVKALLAFLRQRALEDSVLRALGWLRDSSFQSVQKAYMDFANGLVYSGFSALIERQQAQLEYQMLFDSLTGLYYAASLSASSGIGGTLDSVNGGVSAGNEKLDVLDKTLKKLIEAVQNSGGPPDMSGVSEAVGSLRGGQVLANGLLARIDSSLSAGNGDLAGLLEGLKDEAGGLKGSLDSLGSPCEGKACGDYDGIGDKELAGMDTAGHDSSWWSGVIGSGGGSGLKDSVGSAIGEIRRATETPFADGMRCPAEDLTINFCSHFNAKCELNVCDDMWRVRGRHVLEWIGVIMEFLAWISFFIGIA